MDALYPYFLVIHTICAIIFLGFIFCDVVLLAPIKKAFGEDFNDKMWSVIMRRGKKIMPLCVLLLLLTGGAMMTRWVGFEMGFFGTNLQILISIKILLAFIIVAMVAISLTYHFFLPHKTNPLGKIIHPAALVLGLLITILAKLAFHI
ncbi:copper resistance protein CopD [Helicobacter sp. 23-1045]